jgi:hypothetical protein
MIAPQQAQLFVLRAIAPEAARSRSAAMAMPISVDWRPTHPTAFYFAFPSGPLPCSGGALMPLPSILGEFDHPHCDVHHIIRECSTGSQMNCNHLT